MERLSLETLRKLLGKPNATWSSPEQKAGVLAALDCTQDIVAIMATGSGKTMLAIIPAVMEVNKVTVIILPLKSLIADYIRRLDNMQVPYQVYQGLPLSTKTNIILVSADAARTSQWRQEISILHTKIPVVRHFFDEMQVPLTSQGFRAALENLHLLRFLDTQMILASGTIPEIAVPFMIDLFGLGPNHLLLRTSTNRPELQYIWKEPVKSDSLCAAVSAEIDAYPAIEETSRALIFVSLTSVGIELKESLGFPFYNASTLTDSEREAMYQEWIAGKHRVMICTNAFGAGNDYSHTRLVIHAGTPFEMVNYIQEVSRAGRDKQPATCILIPTKIKAPLLTQKHEDYGGKWAIYNALIHQRRCIRMLLTESMDKYGTQCCDTKLNILCSYCMGRFVHCLHFECHLTLSAAKNARPQTSSRRIRHSQNTGALSQRKRWLFFLKSFSFFPGQPHRRYQMLL